MASKVEKDPKKSWFDLDSFIAGYGLRWLKSVVRRRLNEWKMKAVVQVKTEKLDDQGTLYFQIADLFKHGDPADREMVEATARVAVEVIDGLLDQLPFVPKKAKDLADDLGGDAITEIRDHFVNTDAVIPENLTKIKGEQMAKEAGEKLKNLLKEFLTSAFDFLKKIAEQLPKIHAGFSLRPKINGFLETLFATPDPVVLENFSRFVDSELMVAREYQPGFYELVPDDDVQDDFVDMVENWDTFPEFVSWFSKPIHDQRREFAKARMLKQHAGLPRLHRDTTEAIQEGGKAVAGLLHLLNAKLKDQPKPKRSWKIDWPNLSARDKAVVVLGGVFMGLFLCIALFSLYTKHVEVGSYFFIGALSIPCALIYYFGNRKEPSNG